MRNHPVPGYSRLWSKVGWRMMTMLLKWNSKIQVKIIDHVDSLDPLVILWFGSVHLRDCRDYYKAVCHIPCVRFRLRFGVVDFD